MACKFAVCVLVALLVLQVTATFDWISCSDTNVRSIDGTCNNLILTRRKWGSSGSFFENGDEGNEPYPWADVEQLRQRPLPTYADLSVFGSDGPRGNPRAISNALFQRSETAVDSIPHSDFAVFFAQFVNHDFEGNAFINATTRDFFPLVSYIKDPSDPVCQPQFQNGAQQPFRCGPNNTMLNSEARFSVGERDDDGNFQVVNSVTSYLDLSTVYGSTVEWNQQLRSLSGGRMKTQDYTWVVPPFPGAPPPLVNTVSVANLMPSYGTINTTVNFNPAFLVHPRDNVFICGDGRCNENVAMVFMHTVWLREHNLNAAEVAAAHPSWNDEQIFQRARAITIAKYQRIIYEQYIPSEFGDHFADQLGEYSFYRVNENANTYLAFASGAFRYGHTSLNNYGPRDQCGNLTQFNKPSTSLFSFMGVSAAGPVSISPGGLTANAGTLEHLARGLIGTRAGPNGLGAPQAIRNIWIPTGVVDLIVLDILRARHNQLPNYQALREVYYGTRVGKVNKIYGAPGCSSSLENNANVNDSLACFEYISGPGSETAVKLRNLYGKVNRIDPFVGMMAEQHVTGSSFGRTSGNIIMDQYARARDGDRFFYERLLRINYFSSAEENAIRNTNMATVLRRVLNNVVVPENPFLTPDNYLADLAASCAAQ